MCSASETACTAYRPPLARMSAHGSLETRAGSTEGMERTIYQALPRLRIDSAAPFAIVVLQPTDEEKLIWMTARARSRSTWSWRCAPTWLSMTNLASRGCRTRLVDCFRMLATLTIARISGQRMTRSCSLGVTASPLDCGSLLLRTGSLSRASSPPHPKMIDDQEGSRSRNDCERSGHAEHEQSVRHAASCWPARAPKGKTTSWAVIRCPAARTFSITIGCLVDGIRRAVFQLWTVDGGSPIMSATARVPPSRAKRSVSLVIGP
jgi:hypothetical protein